MHHGNRRRDHLPSVGFRVVLATAGLAFCAGAAAQDVPSYLGAEPAEQAAPTTRLTARAVFERIFKAAPETRPDLAKTDMTRLDLAELDFKAALLTGSDLYGSDLSRATLAGASLVGAKLDRATITAT
ncbi:MAG TPA: pentapeptide repeat-containing protein, partial [Hyphomicrobium sp.]|nr:pentapeptide repeat-containing protein [Hyphomicrobium sp.]